MSSGDLQCNDPWRKCCHRKCLACALPAPRLSSQTSIPSETSLSTPWRFHEWLFCLFCFPPRETSIYVPRGAGTFHRWSWQSKSLWRPQEVALSPERENMSPSEVQKRFLEVEINYYRKRLVLTHWDLLVILLMRISPDVGIFRSGAELLSSLYKQWQGTTNNQASSTNCYIFRNFKLHLLYLLSV